MNQPINIQTLQVVSKADEEKAGQFLAEELKNSARKLVVLDDDPTGVQTVHGIHVYTDWTPESILHGFQEENRMFYILTNSRGFTAAQTERAHRQIAKAVCDASRRTGKDFLLLSRSDSTLRGHYPLETQTLNEAILTETGKAHDGEVLCPFFREGGRYTIENIHYVQLDNRLIPAAETEFAKDVTFGFHSSDLRQYIEEKTKGEYRAEDTICITLESLRNFALEEITGQLMNASGFQKIVVNAASEFDLMVFSTALYRAATQGKRFLFRTAASLVKVMGGIPEKPLLSRNDLIDASRQTGGMIVVGSHTEKTTRQLKQLKGIPKVSLIEFDSDLVLDGEAFRIEQERVTALCGELIAKGRTVAVYTKRRLLTVANDTPEEALLRSVKISDAVARLVGNLAAVPSFVIAKGGITSSDVGTKALQVKRAFVPGQIAPGVPVWFTGEESRFPGIPYVIFPGNVGEEHVLREVVSKLID